MYLCVWGRGAFLKELGLVENGQVLGYLDFAPNCV